MLVLRRLRSVPWSHLIVLQVPDDAGHHSVPPDGHRDVGDGGQKLRPVSPTLREERRRRMDSKLSDEDFKIFSTPPATLVLYQSRSRSRSCSTVSKFRWQCESNELIPAPKPDSEVAAAARVSCSSRPPSTMSRFLSPPP